MGSREVVIGVGEEGGGSGGGEAYRPSDLEDSPLPWAHAW